MTHQPTIKLNSGFEMPVLGYGTFLSKLGEIGPAVKLALELGYKLIDCAAAYENEKDIGEVFHKVFSEGKIKREDIFITSKLASHNMNPKAMEAALDTTLSELQLQYLDLYLLHQPVPCKSVGGKSVAEHAGYGIADIWRVMEELQHKGKVRSIGVSNFPTILVNEVLCTCKIRPAVNQIERTPYLSQPKHVKFCRDHGICITSYSPLGNPGLVSTSKPHIKPVLEHDIIKNIAANHKKTPAQVLIKWQMQGGFVVIPKSVKFERIKENFDVFDFELSEDDVKSIDGMNQNLRLFDQEWHGVPTFT